MSPDDLFEKAYDYLKILINASAPEIKCLKFNGIWAFQYLKGADLLQSVYFNHQAIESLTKNYPSLIKDINETQLDCDYGSLAFAFRTLSANDNKEKVNILPNTFNDAKGTVCYYDSLIGQQHAIFVLLKHKGKDFGMLDIFFENIDNANEGEIKSCLESIKRTLEREYEIYKNDCVTAIRLSEYDKFLIKQNSNISDNDEFEKKLSKSITHIEELIAISSKTPLVSVTRKNDQHCRPELVAINFDFIHSIIKHEKRFCALTDNRKKCYYFKEHHRSNDASLYCDNSFLSLFVYDVFKGLDCYIFSNQLEVLDKIYLIEYVSLQKIESVLFSIQEEEIKKYLREKGNFLSINLSIDKLIDECVFLQLAEKVKNIRDIIGVSISREVSPSLSLNLPIDNHSTIYDCEIRNGCLNSKDCNKSIKQFTAPSHLLPIQYGEEDDDFISKNVNEPKQSIIHFKINDAGKVHFIKKLKELISKNPDIYINALEPYVENVKSNYQYNNLELKISGENPLIEENKFRAVITGELHLIEALLNEENIKEHAGRAAMSQVMARNGSHNIGSHVLSRLTHPDYLNKIDDEKEFSGEAYQSSHEYFKDFKSKENIKDILIANFNSYLKSRMDFLADLATGIPVIESSKMAYGELFAGIDSNRLLLNRISGVDKFPYKIVFKDCRNCKKPKGQICNNSDCKDSKELCSADDIALAIPNDILGQHAFYILKENIFRNTAKHGKTPKGQDSVTFTIEISEPDSNGCNCPELSGFYKIIIYDDIDVPESKVTLKNDEIEKYSKYMDCKVRGKNIFKNIGQNGEFQIEVDELTKLVIDQNIRINDSILDKDNKLRQGGWGILEMEAACSYLRKFPIEKIDNPEYVIDVTDIYNEDYGIDQKLGAHSADILKACIKLAHGGKRHLAYRFFMLKPKEILLVVDGISLLAIRECNNIDSQNGFAEWAKSLINHGIWVVYKGDKDNHGLHKFEENKVYNHELLVNLTKQRITPKPGVLPDRILDRSDDFCKWSELLATNTKLFKENCWDAFSETEKLNNISIDSVFINELRIGSTDFIPYNKSNKNAITAVFNHHGKEWPNLYKDYPKKHQYLEVTTGLNNIHELLKKACDKLKGFNESGGEIIIDNERFDKTSNIKLKESILSQVVVFDERVQEAAHSLTYNAENNIQIKFSELYRSAGIFIPDKEKVFNFSATSYPENSRITLKNLLSGVLEKDFNRIRFFVIHLGVLEKVLKAEKKVFANLKEEKEIIDELVKDFCSSISSESSKIKTIIISGRGIPSNLPDNYPFLNYSTIGQYLIDSRNKLYLSEVLFSTRKSQKN